MSIFSQLPPYNTVTSTVEQDAAATGNDGSPSETQAPSTIRVFKSSQMPPMGRILAAVMRGAAAVQGQEQAKTVAAAQANSNSRMSVTMKPGAPGEPPLVTVKDAPADLLNGTQQDDLKTAYNTPKEQVESKLSTAGLSGSQSPAVAAPQSAPVAAPAQDHPLEQAASAIDKAKGYRIPRPWDGDIREKLKSEEGLRAIAEELGLPDTKAEAHLAWRQLKHGVANEDAVAQRIADFRAKRIEQESHNLQATLAPYQQDAEREQTNREQAAVQARLERQLSDSEREKVLTHKKEVIDKTDFSLVEPAKWRETMDSQNASGIPFSEFEYRRGEQKARQDVQKAFNDFVSNKEKYALGDYPTWEQAKVAFGHDLVATFGADRAAALDKQGHAAWDAAHKFAVRKAADDTAQQELRAARLEALQLKVQNASVEKPTTIGRADLNLMSASELVQAEPSSVKNYDSALEQKEGLLKKALADEQDKRTKAHGQAVAIQNKGIQQFGDEEQLAGYRADDASASRRVAELRSELAVITQKRAERRAAAPNVPHKPVGNARYTPQVEAGIAAYMSAAKVGRTKAIEELRAAGRLQ